MIDMGINMATVWKPLPVCEREISDVALMPECFFLGKSDRYEQICILTVCAYANI
jgi:hypothetical protein